MTKQPKNQVSENIIFLGHKLAICNNFINHFEKLVYKVVQALTPRNTSQACRGFLRGAAGPGSATEVKAKTRKEGQKERQRNLLLPNQTAKMATLQMRRTSSQARERKPQPQIRAEPTGHTNKQDATRQLVPIEPSDSYHLMPTFLEDDESTDLRPVPGMIPTDQS